MLLVVRGLDRVSRLLGLRPVLHGAAADVGGVGVGGEPFQVLRGTQPRRRIGRAAFEVFLGRRGLMMGLDGGGPLRRCLAASRPGWSTAWGADAVSPSVAARSARMRASRIAFCTARLATRARS